MDNSSINLTIAGDMQDDDIYPRMLSTAENTSLQIIKGSSYFLGEPIISHGAMQYVYTINMSIICGSLSLIGITTNTINLIIFKRMGFRETINIAFFALAISDLVAMVSLLMMSLCYNPYVMHNDMGILTIEIQYKTVGWNRVIFSRISTMITMYVTLERCLCVAFPLKIKQILTPKRVWIILLCTSVVVIISLGEVFVNFSFGWKFDARRNRTVFGIAALGSTDETSYIINMFNTMYTVLPFFTVGICSAILTSKLQQRSKWLASAKASTVSKVVQNGGDTNKLSKDAQVIKLVILVAIIFIISYIPSIGAFIISTLGQRFEPGGQYFNLFIVVASTMYIAEAIGCGFNILVYYKMSSKYAKVFDEVLCTNKTKTLTSESQIKSSD